ncbi:tail fiber domain-containing protein [Flavobacterium sp. LAR06]|uniref:tail fiber domain-containing protein n=1 Tax=Flavobacterium sp. LAR06 TaxID=3064897 RepID=UPI0035C08700
MKKIIYLSFLLVSGVMMAQTKILTSVTGEKVVYTPVVDGTDLAKGIVQFATAEEILLGQTSTKVIHPLGLKTELDKKANLASPIFTGTPSLPTGTTGITQAVGDSSTKLATTEFVNAKITAMPAVVAATESVSGIVELATAAETTTGTDASRAVHPAGLKVELDKKANLSGANFTGNIGIQRGAGINPISPLDVVAPSVPAGEASFVARFMKNGLIVGSSTFIGIGTQHDDTYDVTKGAIGYVRTGSFDVGDLTFNINNQNSSTNVTPADERMRIKSNGNVGIGTTTPAAKLDVAGPIRTTLSGTSAVGTMSAGMLITSNTAARLMLEQPNAAEGNKIFIVENAGGKFNVGSMSDNSTAWQQMNIITATSNGNVGIGNGAPAAKLDVAGTIKISGGTPGIGKVLTSDATGLASWAEPAVTTVADATETAKGIVELATAAETTAGTDNTRAIHAAGLKVELDKKANLASPIFTGTPSLPTGTTGITQAVGDNSTKLATTEFVNAKITAIPAVVAATESVSGIVELATAAETTTGTDATRAVHPAGLKVELDKKASTAALALKADLASPIFTGTPSLPTGTTGVTQANTDNSTKLATTEFVNSRLTSVTVPDASQTVKGIVQLATTAETTAGIVATKAVHPAGLKVELNKGPITNGDGSDGYRGVYSFAPNEALLPVIKKGAMFFRLFSDHLTVGTDKLGLPNGGKFSGFALPYQIGDGVENIYLEMINTVSGAKYYRRYNNGRWGTDWTLIPTAVPATESVSGIVELATAAETTTGTDATRAVHPAGLKVELEKKANLSGANFTGNIGIQRGAGINPISPLDVVAPSVPAGEASFVARFMKNGLIEGSSTFIGIGTQHDTTHDITKGAIGYVRTGGFDVGDLTFNINNQNSSTNVTPADERMRIKSNGNVGIGTTTPSAKLDVAGTIKISGGAPGAGKVLTSDATGLASWVAPAVATVPDASQTVKGIVQLATAAETTTGTVATKAVHPQGLKVELDKKANLSGATFTGNIDIGGLKIVSALAAGDQTSGAWIRTNAAEALVISQKGDGYFNYNGGAGKSLRFYSVLTGAPGIGVEAMTIREGNVGIGNNAPSQKLHVNGNVLASAILTTSDERLKINIKNLDKGLETINALRPVSYDKKVELKDSQYTMKEDGFIAQELQKVLPDLVKESKDADKILSINYIEIIPILTKAIQEQQLQIEEQKAQIEKQQLQIDAILKTINKK